MESRFMRAALSGTRMERNTSTSSRNDIPTIAPMKKGMRSPTRSDTSMNVAVSPPT